FRAGVEVGQEGSGLTGDRLRDRYDAVVLAVGSTVGRDLPVPGRELAGIHQAMEYLPQSNRASLGQDPVPSGEGEPITAAGKAVVIIGGGHTGADCLGTAIRQQAASVTQLEILAQPPDDRPAHQPWPTYPMVFRVSSAHEEAGDRVYAVSTQEFLGDDHGVVRALKLVEVDGSTSPVRSGPVNPIASSTSWGWGSPGPSGPG